MLQNFVAGDTKVIKLELSYNGNPLNITGSTIYFSLKNDKELIDFNANMKKVISEHTEALMGKSMIILSHDDTKNLTAGTYYWDIRLKDASGSVMTLKRGKVDIIKPITNDL